MSKIKSSSCLTGDNSQFDGVLEHDDTGAGELSVAGVVFTVVCHSHMREVQVPIKALNHTIVLLNVPQPYKTKKGLSVFSGN